jgi:hypothetical protein
MSQMRDTRPVELHSRPQYLKEPGLLENLIGSAGPREGFGVFVVHVDELANRRLQFTDAAEGAAPNPLVCEFGEPSPVAWAEAAAFGPEPEHVSFHRRTTPAPDRAG